MALINLVSAYLTLVTAAALLAAFYLNTRNPISPKGSLPKM